MKVRNLPTDEGCALGEQMARFTDQAEPIARLKFPELPPRCNSCAFRKGDHAANGSPTTQMDALKCVMEGHEFLCHEPARESALCSGWAMWMLAKDDVDFTTVDWQFSDEPVEQRETATPPQSAGAAHAQADVETGAMRPPLPTTNQE